MGRFGPFVASALIILGVFIGFALMPRIMAAASGGGPIAGVAIAILFILAFFGVLWARARYQARRRKD